MSEAINITFPKRGLTMDVCYFYRTGLKWEKTEQTQ